MKLVKNILRIFVIVFIVIACNKDNLNQPALGQLDEMKLANKIGVEQLLIGAYALLDGVSVDNFGVPSMAADFWASAASNWVYGSICGSEAYKGSAAGDQSEIIPIESFKSLATNSYFQVKWAVVYGGAQRANSVLRVMRKATDLSTSDTIRYRAEALFLRAFYHFEAAKMWNKVPFVDESIVYDSNNYHMPGNEFIWKYIESDLLYAIENLPATQPDALGRPNSYAAKAFLAKAYMFQREYAKASPILQDLIQNGMNTAGQKYQLVNYADNFNPQKQDNAETVFAVQTSVNDGATTFEYPGNGNAGDILNFPFGDDAPGGCCGFFQPSQYLVNHFKTDPVTGLPDLDNFNNSDVKNDEGLTSNQPFTIYSGPLDPRLDWTVGRRGIPYLDWGLHPGLNWIRFPYYGPYSPIKNVYYKSQEGLYNDQGSWTKGLVANDVNLIRFADVLLWAAEVEVEMGNLDQARQYVNQVRERAMNPSGWVKSNSGLYAPYAANYHIGLYPADTWTNPETARKAVRYERMLELAMEGHRFFDLVRWGIAETEINAYVQKEMIKRPHLKEASFRKGVTEYFPIPQREIDLSAGPDGIPQMKQNPGY